MKYRYASFAVALFALMYVIWDFSIALLMYRDGELSKTLDKRITDSDISAIFVLVSAVVALALANEAVYYIRFSATRGSFIKRRVAWVVGLVASNASAQATNLHSADISIHSTVPSLSPVVAVSVLSHIEAKRRQQIEERFTPDKFSQNEYELLNRVRVASLDAPRTKQVIQLDNSGSSHPMLLQAVNRPKHHSSEVDGIEIRPWLVEVKVFGYPKVVSKNGGIAEFRKKRALELLTWLVLNRENGRRSAARTALWEIDISDSAFSTIVSDMRRGLRELMAGQEEVTWVPATYSDELSLNDLVVTDADRLQGAYQAFIKSGGSDDDEITAVLHGIRDVPFAGTNYSWADFDGTTTRLVISAVETCIDIAKKADEMNRGNLLTLAVGAGLKVLPRCEELLELQDKYLSQSFRLRRKDDTHHFV